MMEGKVGQKAGQLKSRKSISPLTLFFNLIHQLPQQAAELINRHSFQVSLKWGKFLVNPFDKNENLYLLQKGVIRGYMLDEGREITTWINEENEIVGSIRNHGLELETEEYLQALEDCRLTAIPISVVQRLYADFAEANIIGRIILEESYREAEERAYICRIPSAEKRYDRFLATQPGLLNRIPLKYIASYLGITLETLSRVRAKKRRSKNSC